MFNFLFNAVYYFISFAIGLFFLLLGLIAMALPWSTLIRTNLIELILENSIAISLFGFGFLIVGVTFLVSLWGRTKRRYYYKRVTNDLVAIDETIIRHYLEEYWMRLFPHQQIPTRLSLRKNRIKVDADLPYKPAEERKVFMEQIQSELKDLFQRVLGYSHDFTLAISFQSKKR